MVTGLGSARDLASGRKGAFYNTLEEFSKYWERIDIICPKLVSLQACEPVNLFDKIYIHVSSWPLILHPLWFLKKALEIYKEQKFDLITVHDFPPFYNGIGVRLLWQKIRVPYILEFHHISGYPRPANLKEKIYAKPVLWKIYWTIFGSKVKAIRVVNQKQTPCFLKKVGVPENKIVYIPSTYINLDVFKPLNLSKEYDLIFVGRLEKNKGIDLLLKAVQIINTQYTICNIKVLIIGDGSERKNYESQIINYGLKNNVEMFGCAKDQNEIAELMNKSKVLIMTSYNEGGPRVVLEAMACGIPVLATNVGLMPDFANKKAVKIVDWSAEDVANKTRDLLGNEEEMKRLSVAGSETAKQFEKKAMIKNYAEKIKSLMIKVS